jgi:pyroglutamyl-peptidase
MSPPLLALVTGFGPFVNVEQNPSGELARRLESEPPDGVVVKGAELPVTFAGSAAALREFVGAHAGRAPRVMLSMGVQTKPAFRLERGARARLDSVKPDNDGVRSEGVAVLGERDLATTFDIEALADCLRSDELDPVRLSDDAGGFVCERTYYELLSLSEELAVPALFLHVPPWDVLAPERQLPHVRALLARMLTLVETRA